MGKLTRKVNRAHQRAKKITESDRAELATSVLDVGKAKARLARAQTEYGDAETRYRYLILTIRERYGLGEGDGINTDTGVITRNAGNA